MAANTSTNSPLRSRATGAIASGGTLGILIPPSTIMVIYGIVTETNIGKLFAAGILPGITRDSIIKLAESLGIPVVETLVPREMLYIADEVFFCGTGAQVAIVTEIDHRRIGTGAIGPIGQKLQETYFGVVRGKNSNYADWLTPVY